MPKTDGWNYVLFRTCIPLIQKQEFRTANRKHSGGWKGLIGQIESHSVTSVVELCWPQAQQISQIGWVYLESWLIPHGFSMTCDHWKWHLTDWWRRRKETGKVSFLAPSRTLYLYCGFLAYVDTPWVEMTVFFDR